MSDKRFHSMDMTSLDLYFLSVSVYSLPEVMQNYACKVVGSGLYLFLMHQSALCFVKSIDNKY